MDVLKLSDEEILKEAYQLRVAYGLKRTIRYASQRNLVAHNESVAEHIFALIFLAHYFLRVEPNALSLDREKTYSMLLFHDFGEIKYGDVSTYSKTKEHEEREKEAAKEIFASLPKPLDTVGYDLWHDYEEHTNPEARFCYALDKIEPLFELLDPGTEGSIKRLKVTYEMHVANKFKAAKEYPVMMRFVEVISKDMLSRGIFWKDLSQVQ